MIFIFKTLHVLYSRLAMNRIDTITKKLDSYLYFHFMFLFFANMIGKMIIKRKKKIALG